MVSKSDGQFASPHVKVSVDNPLLPRHYLGAYLDPYLPYTADPNGPDFRAAGSAAAAAHPEPAAPASHGAATQSVLRASGAADPKPAAGSAAAAAPIANKIGSTRTVVDGGGDADAVAAAVAAIPTKSHSPVARGTKRKTEEGAAGDAGADPEGDPKQPRRHQSSPAPRSTQNLTPAAAGAQMVRSGEGTPPPAGIPRGTKPLYVKVGQRPTAPSAKAAHVVPSPRLPTGIPLGPHLAAAGIPRGPNLAAGGTPVVHAEFGPRPPTSIPRGPSSAAGSAPMVYSQFGPRPPTNIPRGPNPTAAGAPAVYAELGLRPPTGAPRGPIVAAATTQYAYGGVAPWPAAGTLWGQSAAAAGAQYHALPRPPLGTPRGQSPAVAGAQYYAGARPPLGNPWGPSLAAAGAQMHYAGAGHRPMLNSFHQGMPAALGGSHYNPGGYFGPPTGPPWGPLPVAIRAPVHSAGPGVRLPEVTNHVVGGQPSLMLPAAAGVAVPGQGVFPGAVSILAENPYHDLFVLAVLIPKFL